jgi:small-conductance mechanosensitive channel
MTHTITTTHWIAAISLVLGGLILGVIFQKFVFARLKALARRTPWPGDDIIVNALNGIAAVWFATIGAYIAIQNLSLTTALSLYLHRILLVIIILSCTVALAKIAGGLVRLYTSKFHGVLPTTTLFANLTKVLIFIIGILIIIQTLGIAITPIITALGIGGLAVALALQDSLSNLFAGLRIIASKNYKIGDYIKLNTGEEGYIADISWWNTTIKNLANNIVILPNSKLAAATVTNYYLPEKELLLIVELAVNYENDLDKVERITSQVAQETLREVPGGVPEYLPLIRYHSFGPLGVEFSVILRIKEFVNQYSVKHNFIKRLYKRYREDGIKVPSPVLAVKTQQNS